MSSTDSKVCTSTQAYSGMPTPAGGTAVPNGFENCPGKAQVAGLLESSATKYQIPPEILKAIAFKESRWNNNAVGDHGNSTGMMQVYKTAHPDYDLARGHVDAAYNVDYGAKLLRTLYNKYGSWDKAVERYNGSGPMARAYCDDVMGNIVPRFRATQSQQAAPATPPQPQQSATPATPAQQIAGLQRQAADEKVHAASAASQALQLRKEADELRQAARQHQAEGAAETQSGDSETAAGDKDLRSGRGFYLGLFDKSSLVHHGEQEQSEGRARTTQGQQKIHQAYQEMARAHQLDMRARQADKEARQARAGAASLSHQATTMQQQADAERAQAEQLQNDGSDELQSSFTPLYLPRTNLPIYEVPHIYNKFGGYVRQEQRNDWMMSAIA